ncbi:Gfo/Idh/MocA family oxidoreductase [Amycolatopsis acidiphila]|uniref:Gfo/Idh/MocA family oxidoreductase n=1 Tax=Amycolatopsis acidiphila TaxID=715473 RepID=A0A558AM60_9PSEU|nr:Gfo/Idh/MocA family oxidoreductase [Amycolatopsis acidiphila]TVT25354.1 Gfo/Idh/MocA family oxidoreductase [Amycolatopsis acidiphila]UIJ62485.1 Gfo/Idh/MocA family oxidoreductase [Amycolatopsis acidiphila]GHG83896.1 oxidoreductase [Amycolatopsis acidiphila]
MAEPVGFALVGLGYGATRCQMLAETPTARLAAVVDANAERAREYGERYDVPWFTDVSGALTRDDVDVVGIYTPSGLHLDLAAAVANAGKHVLLTKPMEVNLARSDAIADTCADAGVELFGEFYLRYYEDNWRLKNAIDSGVLGRLILGEFGFKCFRPDEYYRSDGAWRQTWELNGGGVVMNQAIHAIDKLTWCMGEVESVHAVTGTYAHDIPVEDTAVAALTLRSGAMAVLVATSTFRTTSGMDDIYGGGFTTRAEVNGDRGSLSLLDDVLTMEKFDQGSLGRFDGKPLNVFDDIAGALTEAGYESATLARGEQARRPVEIAMAIYDSARAGKPVRISDYRRDAVGEALT